MRTVALPLVFALGTVSLCSGACGSGTDAPSERRLERQIEVDLRSTDGTPLPGAPVRVDGRTVGYTDREGAFRATLREEAGDSVEISLGSLAGYSYIEEPSVRRRLQTGKTDDGPPARIELRAVAEPTTSSSLVWIRAHCDAERLQPEDCRGLPILRDGREIARTGPTGSAHILLREEPGTKLNFTLGTPSPGEADRTPLAPADPTFEFELASTPRIFLVEESFRRDDRETTTSEGADEGNGPDEENEQSDDDSESNDGESAVDLF